MHLMQPKENVKDVESNFPGITAEDLAGDAGKHIIKIAMDQTPCPIVKFYALNVTPIHGLLVGKKGLLRQPFFF